MERSLYRPTMAEIDLSAIARNMTLIGELAGQRSRIIAVVKADGYGHGAVPIARCCLDCGAAALAVSSLDEADELRRAGIEAPVVVLGAILPQNAADCLAIGATPAVSSYEFAAALSLEATRAGQTVGYHLKMDTGMGRTGFGWQEAPDVVHRLSQISGIRLDGVMSHFATADVCGDDYAALQIENFRAACRHILSYIGINRSPEPMLHMANSAALLRCREALFDAVRPGICLYGQPPYPGAAAAFIPAMTLKTAIVHIRDYPPGCYVGYGRTYCTAGSERIAVLPIGYADGISRRLSNNGQVLVNGRRAPIVGRLCMDQMMIDVTGIEGAGLGTEAVLIGRSGEQEIGAWEVAEWVGTISNEILTSIGKRVPRIYTAQAKPRG